MSRHHLTGVREVRRLWQLIEETNDPCAAQLYDHPSQAILWLRG
jgi:hypothetical protein